MVFREQYKEDNWRVARERLAEQELSERYHQAFAAFEREWHERAPAQPPLIELELGSELETYYPEYTNMKLEGMVGTVLFWLSIWFFGALLVSVLGVVGIFVLPEPLVAPVMIGAMLLGVVGVGAFAVSAVRDTWRHNQVKRAAPGDIGYGTFLLADAVIWRYPGGASFYPRDSVQELDVERTAAVSSAGGSTGVRHTQSPESRVYFRYANAFSESKRAPFIAGRSFLGHDDPEPARRLQAWIQREGGADERPGFGHEPAVELSREDYARGWRSFRRRRIGALVGLTGPWVLFIGTTVMGNLIGNEWLSSGFGLAVLPVVALLVVPGVVAFGLYRAARCPRCGKSPGQPLAGTDVTRCLSCGLPIFTKARAPAQGDEASAALP